MIERIYLDYNATSIIDQEVVNLMSQLIKEPLALNPSSIHTDGRKARAMMEVARQQIAEALGFHAYKDDLQIIFTSSGTEANNLAISSFKDLPIFMGATEHVSILEAANGIIISVNQDGIITPENLSNILKLHQGAKLVSIMLANNETGIIQNIKELVKIAHQENAIFHCDASQAFCKIDVDFNDLGCDLLTISSHKCGGPLGAAALITKKKIKLVNMIKGGKQEQGLRAGTENLLAISGFGLAAQACRQKIAKFKEILSLKNKLEQEVLDFSSDCQIIGSNVNRLPNTSSIRMPNVKSEEQLIKFDLAGISISAGSACSSGRIASSHVLKAMNIAQQIADEVVRISLGLQTTKEEINKFLFLWKKIYNKGQ